MNILHSNPILANDSYKLSHAGQTPGVTTETYSHLTPRGISSYLRAKYPNIEDKVIVYGVQMTMQIIADRWQTEFFDRSWDNVSIEALAILLPFIGTTIHDLERFKSLHELGYLPLRVKALEEGLHVPVGLPIMTVVNTHPDFAWLTNFIESTILNTIYKPMTVATIGLEYAKLRDKYFDLTVSDQSGKAFALHDFSYRGHAGHESAAAAVSGYLLYTRGTDTMAAIQYANYYYKAYDIANSLSAGEHSTMSVGIQFYKDILNEYENGIIDRRNTLSIDSDRLAYQAILRVVATLPKDTSEEDKKLAIGETTNLVRLLVDVYPSSRFACVADTYDYYRFISIILPAVKDIILARDGKFIVRPDSADPVKIICGTLNSSTTYTLCPDVDLTNPEEILEDIKDTLLDVLEARTPHGERGESSFTGIFSSKDGRYFKGTISDVIWDRVQYKYYFIDDSCVTVSVEEIIPGVEEKGTVEVLAETFGTTVNELGFKELVPQIGLVYGDGINYDRATRIYQGLMEKGFAANNVCLALGAFTLAHLSRDELMFAIKASNMVVNSESIPVYKEPKTDSAKKSPKGYLAVVQTQDTYVLLNNVSKDLEESGELQEIWCDGQFTKRTTFEEIRSRLPL